MKVKNHIPKTKSAEIILLKKKFFKKCADRLTLKEISPGLGPETNIVLRLVLLWS